MNSNYSTNHLPDHMKIMFNKGLLGINNYIKMLEAIKSQYSNQNMREKFRNTEKHMNDCMSTLGKAEDKVV